MVSGQKCRPRSLYRSLALPIVPRAETYRPPCWTMRHRITSFRALKPTPSPYHRGRRPRSPLALRAVL